MDKLQVIEAARRYAQQQLEQGFQQAMRLVAY